MVCAELRGSVTATFFGITGLSQSEIVTSDWLETSEGYSWPGLVSAGTVLDATPDYIGQIVPVVGGYVYTRQSNDLTTVDLIGPGGTIYTWTTSESMSYALAVDASGDYWLVVAEDDGTASADVSLWRVTPGGTATKEVPSTSASDGVSPGPIATTPDGAVWFSKYGTGSGLYRWASGAASAVSGVGSVTPVPRPDSSVWYYTGSEWRSITSGLVVSGSSPCVDFDPVTPHSVAWTDDWSIVAVQDPSGDVYELIRSGRRWWVGSAGWGGTTTTCVVTLHAAATDNTYSPPRASVSMDEAGMSNPCALDVTFDPLGSVPDVIALIPPGTYSGMTATIEWGDGASAECYLAVEDDASVTIEDDIETGTTPVNLSVGPFTVPAPYGRVYIFADFTAAGGTHTIDPATVITITKT